METWGNKVKVALSRLGKTDNYLYTKPEQDWTQEDKQLVISLLRKSKVAENTQMEDLKKIQEFFSKPVNEFEGEELSLGDTIKINPASFPSFEFPYGTEGEIIDISKADYASDDLVYRVKLRYIDGQGDEANTLYIENSNQYLNEQEEDAIDTISMDVPLFLRMLEYAREDAQEDVDLHDVTQRATELSKTKPFLSMEDYNEIVAAPQEIDEDAFDDTWALNKRKAQSFIEKYPNDVNVGYAKAYLKIDDIVKANKYWNDFNLKNITSGVESLTSMESLKEVVRATLLEKKKKRDRCLRIADRKFDKPSAYKSGAVVRCRDGEIWKDLKEVIYEIIQEDESLYKWFKRAGTPGKEGGWVDCNAPIRKDGKITGYKSCGRKKGEKRAKYPSCRPTAAKCKDPGKGKKWGKTK